MDISLQDKTRRRVSLMNNDHGQLKRWLWFVGLWLVGFLSLAAVGYAIKLGIGVV